MINIQLPENIEKDFMAYCQLNEIEDISSEAIRVFSAGFNSVRYGVLLFKEKPKEQIQTVEKETIKPEKTTTEEKKPIKKVRIIKN